MNRYLVTCFPRHQTFGLRRSYKRLVVAVAWWLRLRIGGYTAKVVDDRTWRRVLG